MSKKVYINYADKTFEKQQKLASKMAQKRGGFDEVIAYSDEDIDTDFYRKNHYTLESKRGGGYWLWKPYFIYKTLQKLNDGDYVFYSDSGAFFVKPIDILIKQLEQEKQDIMGFELDHIEHKWTKQELFTNMDCDSDKYKNSNQIMGSFQLVRKSNFSMNFYKELLDYSCNEMNITDKFDNNINQIDGFIEHRHDQSIFSLLYKKYNLKPFANPSQWGDRKNIVLYLGRRKSKLSRYWKYLIKAYCYDLGIYKGFKIQ